MARDPSKCSCGAPAVVVFETERWGPVGWCGRTDVGQAERSEDAGENAERSEVRWAVEDSEPS